MDIGKNDVLVTMAASIAVIMMSFTFPALGMTGDSVNETDIPEFNVSKGTVDFAREEPEFPSRPSQGTLSYNNGSADWLDGRQVYLQQGGSVQYVLSFFDTDPDPGPANVSYEVNLIKFNSTGSFNNNVLINESETKELESVDGAYEVGLTNLEIVANNSTTQRATIEWEVLSQPSDQTWIGRLPGVGGLISGANQLASIVGWIASIAWHFVTLFLVTIGNTLLMFANVVLFFIDSAWWLASTYSAVVAGAPTSWASVIVAIPGILLGFQFAKIIAVGISLLPFT